MDIEPMTEDIQETHGVETNLESVDFEACLEDAESSRVGLKNPVPNACDLSQLLSSKNNGSHTPDLPKRMQASEKEHQSGGLGPVFDIYDNAINWQVKSRNDRLNCDMCGATFTKSTHLEKHMRAHSDKTPCKCKVCRPSRNKKIKKRKQTDGESYNCKICNTAFMTSTALLKHMKTTRKEKPFKCRICVATFSNHRDLEVHKRKHTGEKYPSKNSETAFLTCASLKTHEKYNTVIAAYKCKICGESHCKSNTEKILLKCIICGINLSAYNRFTAHQGLDTEQEILHTEEDILHTGDMVLTKKEILYTEREINKCEFCGFVFKKKWVLDAHRKKHLGIFPYKCEKCGAGFVTGSDLNKHKMKESGVRPYKCDICGDAFLVNSMLKLHKRIHTGEKPHKCEICSRAFRLAGQLTVHKNQNHTREKSWTCHVCGTAFFVLGHLKHHMRKHSEERPFMCEICGATFKAPYNLTFHKRKHT